MHPDEHDPHHDHDAKTNPLHGRSYLSSPRTKAITPVHEGVEAHPIPSRSVLHMPPPEVGVEDYEPEDATPQAVHDRRMNWLMLLLFITGIAVLAIGLWIWYLKLL